MMEIANSTKDTVLLLPLLVLCAVFTLFKNELKALQWKIAHRKLELTTDWNGGEKINRKWHDVITANDISTAALAVYLNAICTDFTVSVLWHVLCRSFSIFPPNKSIFMSENARKNAETLHKAFACLIFASTYFVSNKSIENYTMA